MVVPWLVSIFSFIALSDEWFCREQQLGEFSGHEVLRKALSHHTVTVTLRPVNMCGTPDLSAPTGRTMAWFDGMITEVGPVQEEGDPTQ